MDIDLNAPAFVTADARVPDATAGAALTALSVAVDMGDSPRLPAEDGPSTRGLFEVDGSRLPLLPRARREHPIADHQLLAAAELIHRGFARRILLANAAVDSSLPADCVIRGVAIHLDRLPDGRTRVTAGQPRM